MQGQIQTDNVDITPAQFNNFFTSIGPKNNSESPQILVQMILHQMKKSFFSQRVPQRFTMYGLTNSQTVDKEGLNNLFVKFFSPIICKPPFQQINESGMLSDFFQNRKKSLLFLEPLTARVLPNLDQFKYYLHSVRF